jgi:signal transduction histidine kinase
VRSLANRLALVFFLIILGAMAIVYVGVVPNLRSSLVDDRAERLERAARRSAPAIAGAIDSNSPVGEVDRLVREAADDANARVTLLGVNRGVFGPQPFVKSDSNATADIRDLRFPAAAAAIESGRSARATESGRDGRVVELAVPLSFRDTESGNRLLGSVVVYSAPLEDVEANVDLVRDRILIAGLLALAAAVIAGFLVAQSLGRRVARLEHVARRVSTGDFSARFTVDRDDELGRLAAALDAMQRQLAELDTARRGFIATASHELRTPVFSLGGFLELLEDEELDAETRAGFMAQLRTQVDRLGKLTTDLLDLSRLEAGGMELRTEETDVGRLAQTVAGEFAPALAAHGSELELRLGDEPLEIVCDPERVAQVLRVLLDNAIAHTPPGTGVALEAARDDDRVRLTVTDAGGGIPRGELHRVFEPFYTSDGRRGSGLGLAIAHELCERMGGELTAESRPGRTAFTLAVRG